MDKKEHALLTHYLRKLNNHTFDEKDIYAFILLLKKQNRDVRWLNEMADFVVKREQYTGLIKDYLFEIRKRFASMGQTKATIRIQDVFSFKEIRNGLNKVLAECQCEELSNEEINDFVVCLISILQQITITDEHGKEIGKLFLAISNKQVILMAELGVSQNLFKQTNVVFPVLTANNRYIDIKKQDQYDTPYLFADDAVEVIRQEGRLVMNILAEVLQD
ncbi:hypothetical protein [Bacillus sp. T3]|uniref:hypothetical protein n=1 Tax=Bacillus sp. T3 TaxID=467262 RepID=UPI00298173EA|nr:hypothetical protein [Bacillus sp. T3]